MTKTSTFSFQNTGLMHIYSLINNKNGLNKTFVLNICLKLKSEQYINTSSKYFSGNVLGF